MPFRANLEGSTDSEKQRVVDCVRIVSNFPKPGLEFKDMSILLGQPDAFHTVINSLVHRYKSRPITGASCSSLHDNWGSSFLFNLPHAAL